jgi:predicted lipid-binding transport protein (Tim44 family)
MLPNDSLQDRERFSMNNVEHVQKTAQSQKDTADLANQPANPRSGSSLMPMLVAGLVLVLGGMIAALTFS